MQNVAVTNYSVPKTLGAGEILRDILILFMLLKYLFCGQFINAFYLSMTSLVHPVFWGQNCISSTVLLPPGGPRGYKLQP